MALSIRYRLDASASAPVKLSVACGENCGASLDVTPWLGRAPLHEWRTLKVRLACFRAKGVKMDAITSPFRLETSAPLTLAFTDIRLDYNQGDAVACPD
jgi:beta-glucosidase